MAVHKLVDHHRQAQEDYIHLLHENERLKSFLSPEALAQVAAQSDPNHQHPVAADGRIDKGKFLYFYLFFRCIHLIKHPSFCRSEKTKIHFSN